MAEDTSLELGYTSTDFGQMHWRIWSTGFEREGPDLVCCHPGPFSGLAFQNIAPHLAKGRRVIAPDYPGYGGSSPLGDSPTIKSYALACASVARDLCGNRKVDLLGFHAGCAVSAEWALTTPDQVRKLCLIDAPAFDPETSKDLASSHSGKLEIGDDFRAIEALWTKHYLSRLETQGSDEAMSMFVECLRSVPKTNEVFRAAFLYEWMDRYPLIQNETLVLATKSQLLEGTRAVAQLIPGAGLVEDLGITRSVLDEAAQKTSSHIRDFLRQ